jgi:hypothetical protein
MRFSYDKKGLQAGTELATTQEKPSLAAGLVYSTPYG